MFDKLKKILIPSAQNQSPKDSGQKKIHVAACALFIEIAKADSSFDEVERDKIFSIMKKSFSLQEDYVKELIELASVSVNKSISLYEFTPSINEHFTPAEKFALLKDLWRLVYVDNKLDKYEEHLVKRIGNMIGVEYSDIIAAKLLVKEETKI